MRYKFDYRGVPCAKCGGVYQSSLTAPKVEWICANDDEYLMVTCSCGWAWKMDVAPDAPFIIEKYERSDKP